MRPPLKTPQGNTPSRPDDARQGIGRPLMEAQQGIWYAQKRDPDSPVFMTGQALHIDGPLDRAALEAAVNQAAQEAGCLSLRFAEGPEGPVQSLSGQPPKLAFRDLSCRPEDAPAAILAEARSPVDLARGPIAGFTLWRLGPERHILSERIHHLAADGYAMVLITNRIAELYNAAQTGSAPAPAFPPYEQALAAEAAYRDAPRRAADRDHWHQALAGLGPVPGMAEGEAVTSRWFHRAEQPLPRASCDRLMALSKRLKLPWPDILTAMTGAFVARHLPSPEHGAEGGPDCVLGLPLMNRMGSKAARVPCTQVNVLPLPLRVDEDAPLTDWLTGAARHMAAARRHGRYRGEALRREMGRLGAGQRLHGPLVNVLPFDATPRLCGLVTRLQILGAGSVDDLTFCIRGTETSGLLLQIDANPALYDAALPSRLILRLTRFLTRALQADTLAEVDSLTPAEQHSHVLARNATTRPLPQASLPALIRRRLRAAPDAPALIHGDTTLTAARFDARVEELARVLAARGIGPGDRVAVALPRSPDLVVALHGVMRAGAAYVPLDPDDTSERRANMLADAAPALVLADPGFDDHGSGLPRLAPRDWQEAPQTDPRTPGPQDLAYVLFTSGSTGRPKGVEIPHEAIVNRLLWMGAEYGIGPGDRILQKTPATFDVSVWEFFLPFLTGAALVVAPDGAHRDPAQLARLIRDHGVTTAHFVPSMLALFLAAPDSAGLTIPRVFASGEALPTDLARRFHARISGALHNLYGPTEAAVDVTFQPATGQEQGASVPIGRPVWNTRCYLLDDRLRPVPDGTPGRLFLAGLQLARGYAGRPDLTAERFLPDPFHPGQRMYDTGDMATADATGLITYLGRRDGQVKIRGVRIETGEIEAALTAHPGVTQAAVLARSDGSGGARLVAWVTGTTPAETLKAHLAAHLPAMMQPQAIVALDTLPLTPSGKLDRARLPDPAFGPAQSRAAQTGTERQLAGLYAQILGLPEPAGADTDFFRAGGDSLRAVQLTLAIEEIFGRDPGLGAIFETPVLADLARRLDAQVRGDDALGPVLRLGGGTGLQDTGSAGTGLPGTGLQGTGLPGTGAPLFVIHPAGGIAWCYRALAALLPCPVIGLQSPLLSPGAPPATDLSELARSYADRVEAECPDGPLHLLGWSLGGILAHAMTAELEARGREVAGLTLLDAYPSDCWRDQPEPDEDAALRALLAIAGHDPDDHPDIRGRDGILNFLRAQGHPLGQLPPAVQTGVVRSVQAVNRLVRGHRETPVRARLTHVHAHADHAGTALQPGLWAPYAPNLRVLSLDCRHAEMVGQPAIARIAALLRQDLAPTEERTRDRLAS